MAEMMSVDGWVSMMAMEVMRIERISATIDGEKSKSMRVD